MAPLVDVADQVEGEVAGERADVGRAWAALAVVGAAGLLAVLPALVTIGAAAVGTQGLVAALAGLAAVLGGVKLAAMAWGLAAAVD